MIGGVAGQRLPPLAATLFNKRPPGVFLASSDAQSAALGQRSIRLSNDSPRSLKFRRLPARLCHFGALVPDADETGWSSPMSLPVDLFTRCERPHAGHFTNSNKVGSASKSGASGRGQALPVTGHW